jgi:hypothetical protein
VSTVLTGFNAKHIYDAYRKACADMDRPEPGLDRFAYLALLAVGSSEAEARRRGEIVIEYLRTSAIVSSHYKVPPGYFSVNDTARMVRSPNLARPLNTPSGKTITLNTASLDELIDAGVVFCGTPDQVYHQAKRFNDGVGGIGNLMLMGQAGRLNHAETSDSLTLFAKEVMPRLISNAKQQQAA